MSALITGNTFQNHIKNLKFFFLFEVKLSEEVKGSYSKAILSIFSREVHINILIIATVMYYTITDSCEKKDTEATSLMQSFNDMDNQELGEDNGALVYDDEELHQKTTLASNDIRGQPSEILQKGRDWHLLFV